MPRTIPTNPRPRTLALMEGVRKHAPAAPSMRALAKALGVSTVYLYDLIAWMPDGEHYHQLVKDNKERPSTLAGPIVDALYKRRREMGVSAYALSARLGWGKDRIHNYEHGLAEPPLGVVAAWAKGVGMELKVEDVP